MQVTTYLHMYNVTYIFCEVEKQKRLKKYPKPRKDQSKQMIFWLLE